MKLSTYTLKKSDKELIGLLNKDSLINLNVFFGEICLLELIQLPDWKELIIKKTKLNNLTTHTLEEVKLLTPIPRPNSLRDAYAFRQHVETSRRNRGLEMIKEFDDFPVFYFSNHNAIFGPSDDIQCMPSHFEKLDYELEIAILIGKEGTNIKAENAKEYIAGFMIMNDMSSRGLQMKEMKLNLGPAKGKDFASVLGPYLVTPDELSGNIINEDDNGCNYDLQMTCSLNGKLLSKGNLKDMAWSFEKIIERVSYGATIYPGDIIGSGTVGTGCLLEINGTNKLKSSDFTEVWLKENDVVEMEIEKLGKITNKIISNKSNYKIN
jgi:fumarylacetoacetate (FAA) hydrolase